MLVRQCCWGKEGVAGHKEGRLQPTLQAPWSVRSYVAKRCAPTVDGAAMNRTARYLLQQEQSEDCQEDTHDGLAA
mgnify:FL=1